MKKTIAIISSLLLLTVQEVLPQNEYWKDSSNISWYHWIYQTTFGKPIECFIPQMIIERDVQLDSDTTTWHIPNENTKLQLCGIEYTIDQISYKIESGYTYQAFQHIAQPQTFRLKYSIELRRNLCKLLSSSLAISHCIILHDQYYQLPDAVKLFILHHELQHHIYNDIADNHLEKIINLPTTNSQLKKQLALHKESLRQHIIRYVEYRSDTQAMLAIECPYCIQEIAHMRQNIKDSNISGTYHPHGYLCSWQFTSRINELIQEKKCCQHHNDTGKQINLLTIDESTLLNRLVIN